MSLFASNIAWHTNWAMTGALSAATLFLLAGAIGLIAELFKDE